MHVSPSYLITRTNIVPLIPPSYLMLVRVIMYDGGMRGTMLMRVIGYDGGMRGTMLMRVIGHDVCMRGTMLVRVWILHF
jgi:hypothetical protein